MSGKLWMLFSLRSSNRMRLLNSPLAVTAISKRDTSQMDAFWIMAAQKIAFMRAVASRRSLASIGFRFKFNDKGNANDMENKSLQAMGLPQFLAQANPMMDAVDGAMARMFGKPQTEEDRRAELERKEDEFLARKQMEVTQ